MSNALAIDFTYKYPFASSIGDFEKGFGLKLATCGANQEHPHFFEGKMLQPKIIGDTLLVLSDIVRTHFFLPRLPLMDPVVTSNEKAIRFEGFSGCCGVYGRVDLKPEAFDADILNRGTTNVDFNNPMRSALNRLKDREEAFLSVGEDEVVISKSEERVVEKKVKLPIRWIKGFSEVNAYQPTLKTIYEVSGAEARKFINSLPSGPGPKRPTYVEMWGKSLRISPREKKDTVQICGTNRIRIISPLMSSAKSMRIWYSEEYGISGWEIINDAGKFFLMLSPEVYRGFSGEGQALEKIAKGNWEEALPKVKAQLTWQSNIDIEGLVKKTGFEKSVVEAALIVLGTRGVTGYDVSTGSFFHRVLPFDLDKVEDLQPRLKGARKLLDENKVTINHNNGDIWECLVEGTDVKHTVKLDGENHKCTCPWYSKYQGQRGPCKHILASRMFIESLNNQGEIK